MTVSRETAERLAIYEALIARWNRRINLVAPSTLPDFHNRHVRDCLQIAELLVNPKGLWADLGSGGGLPGIILAIALADKDLNFTLVESDQRKAVFLRTVLRETGLQRAKVLNDRIEAISALNGAYLSARALAPLPRLMPYLDQHLAPTGRAFLMKGLHWQEEVEAAKRFWAFDYVAHPSQTEAGAAILEVSGVRHGA